MPNAENSFRTGITNIYSKSGRKNGKRSKKMKASDREGVFYGPPDPFQLSKSLTNQCNSTTILSE
jgi:hypothetical protein